MAMKSLSTTLGYDVFIAEPIPQNVTELVPNGERRMFSPVSITLISAQSDCLPESQRSPASGGSGLERACPKRPLLSRIA